MEYIDKRICTCECKHRTGLVFQLVAGPSKEFYSMAATCPFAEFACISSDHF